MEVREMKENAKRIIRRYEERKVRLAKELEEIERQEEWSEDEIAQWKAKEFYSIDFNNEAEAVFNTITELGVLSGEEFAEFITGVQDELGIFDSLDKDPGNIQPGTVITIRK